MPTTFRALLAAVALTVISARTASAQQPPPSPAFPDAWLGVWRGTLTIYGAADSVKTRVPATLTIATTDQPGVYRWRTVYANDTTKGMKDYRLRVIDAAAGRYALDEGNGILIDEVLTGGMLVSVFQVGDQWIENRVSAHSDSLVQDLIYWTNTPVRTTGGTGPNGERGAPVMAFRVGGRQRLVARREPQ
jgi:hypothetical protein